MTQEKGTSQETRSILDVVKMIEGDKLVLPEFQRDFKWPMEKSETLFDSIFKNLFIGSLIISKPKFDLACKGFDLRPRGYSGRKPIAKKYKAEKFEIEDIYTLLDGQQRVTSIYRALIGSDVIYIVLKDINKLKSEKYWDNEKERTKKEYSEFIEGFDPQEPSENGSAFYIKINDLYKASITGLREGEFISDYVEPVLNKMNISKSEKKILEEYAIKLKTDFYTEIIKKSNLLSVQLLNMSLEQFCIYFERSNSQGLNLSFTDIITAKVYTDFNLKEKITTAEKEYKYFNDTQKVLDSIVRYINFLENSDVTKKSILKDLKGVHFIDNWDIVVKDFNDVQEWIQNQNWVYDITQIPYKTMLLPIMSFYQNLKHKEFTQAKPEQIDALKFWFYASIMDNRYGGARHGSTNVVLKQDCDLMRNLAKGKHPGEDYWKNLRIELSKEELMKLDSNSSAKFKSINYFMWNDVRFLNLENCQKVSPSSGLEVHHFFPSAYIKRKFGNESEEYLYHNSILNKIHINKISNIKIADKAPSLYLSQIFKTNPNLSDALKSHRIPNTKELMHGEYDDNFMEFINLRYQQFKFLIEKIDRASANLNSGKIKNIWT